ncbi:hypothetical protein CJF31_00011107 [Rutstroemia sp. NJR-2017a BVV2]|nr:hypothetical protein CJF31_00009215 [Rutstroemia sp. NJR-2017a BVV2]PQE21704.1 hypothetical protein CJF31_00011107 [Rutstroemia sp. NJR-2017a BVV2]
MPLTISFRLFLALLVVGILLLCIDTSYAKVNHETLLRLASTNSGWKEIVHLEGCKKVVAASALAAAATPLVIQAILHMQNLPVLVMLFPLAWSADRAILLISGSLPRSSQQKTLYQISVVVIASIIILYDDYRITVHGIALGVSGLISTGASKALFSMACEENRVNQGLSFSNSAHHGFVILTAVFGLLITGSSSYWIESASGSFIPSLFEVDSTLLLFYISSTAAIVLSGGSLLLFSSTSFTKILPSSKDEAVPVSDIFALNLSSVLILWLSMFLASATYVSFIQILAYWTTVFALFVFSRNSFSFDFCSSIHATWWRKEASISEDLGMTSTEASYRTTKRMLLRNFCLTSAPILAWLFVSTVITARHTTQSGISAHLDRDFVAESRFDIVVSMYDEDPTSVRQMLSSIKATKFLSTLQPRVVLYTKNPTSDLTELLVATGANIVERLDNVGREGGTYLHHITQNWDHLANQTMFIQAHAHNQRELIPRLDNFLVSNTGMLSLGFSGVVCDCEGCGDRLGWEDQWGLIPTLYKKLHDTNKCSERVLLSYKGQFVASASRIRGVPLDIYDGLHDAITSTSGWSHDPNVVGDNMDEPDAPYFGYTVERIWNLLMQCSNSRVATMCPSLLSQWRTFGRIEDCQCLD